MTNKEAIRILLNLEWLSVKPERVEEAISMAVAALELYSGKEKVSDVDAIELGKEYTYKDYDIRHTVIRDDIGVTGEYRFVVERR